MREALELSIDLGDQRSIARYLERLAYLAAAQGQSKRALRLASGADALRTGSGLPRAPVESHTLKRWLAPAEHQLEALEALADHDRRLHALLVDALLDKITDKSLRHGGDIRGLLQTKSVTLPLRAIAATTWSKTC